MKCIVGIVIVIIIFFPSVIISAEEPLTSDIADIGKINIGGREVQFFEISGTADIPVTSEVKPHNLPTAIAQDNTRDYSLSSQGELSAPVAAFTLAVVNGVQAAFGYLKDSIIDLKSAYDKNLLQSDPVIKDVIKDQDFDIPPPDQDQILQSPSTGKKFRITSAFSSSGSFGNPNPDAPNRIPGTWLYVYSGYVIFYDFSNLNSSGLPLILSATIENLPGTPDVTYPPDLPYSLSDPQSDQLAAALADLAASNNAVRESLDSVIKNSPSILDQPASITSSDLNRYAQQAVTDANQKLISDLQALVDANPGDTGLAAELAKAKADSDKDTANDIAPSVASPGDFYTKKHDLSNGLASLINYQQVLDAVHAFDETFIVQTPTMLLNCLDYVEGEGCEYPPIVTIDFQNRFSSQPIVIDFAPFVTVANAMKFFFSILCIVMTYKSVMHLFR